MQEAKAQNDIRLKKTNWSLVYVGIRQRRPRNNMTQHIATWQHGTDTHEEITTTIKMARLKEKQDEGAE